MLSLWRLGRAMFVVEEYGTGKKIVCQGARGPNTFLIRSGKVEVYQGEANGNKKTSRPPGYQSRRC